MMQHRELVATAFRIAAFLLGIPSSTALAFFGFGAVRLHVLGTEITAEGKSGDALIDLLVSGARMFGSLFELFGGAVKWAFTLLSVLSFGCTLFALLLYYTGRGLQGGRSFARVCGILLAVAPLLISLFAVASTRRPVPLLVSLVIFGLSGYVIWALGWRFES